MNNIGRGIRSDWGLRIQTLVISFMLATGLGPYQIGNGRNGCPVVVPPTTIAYFKVDVYIYCDFYTMVNTYLHRF